MQNIVQHSVQYAVRNIQFQVTLLYMLPVRNYTLPLNLTSTPKLISSSSECEPLEPFAEPHVYTQLISDEMLNIKVNAHHITQDI